MPNDPDETYTASLRRVLLSHSRRYPLWKVEDLYKLIHQAAMGSEHAVSDEAGAREWLREEIRNLGPGPEEPLVDLISPGGEVARVHLRPFVRTRRKLEVLLHAFLRTASEFSGSMDRLEAFGRQADEIAAEGALSFNEQEVKAYLEKMKEKSFPAVHHSAVFAIEYRPAYRVVASAFLPVELISDT